MARRSDTRAPRRARERALKLLFQADLRSQAPADVLAAVEAEPGAVALLDDDGDAADGAGASPSAKRDPVDELTRRLVCGVGERRDELDALIGRFAHRWSVGRMPVVDRNVLRLATYELVHDDTSAAIVIDGAVELAKRLSTDDSGRFVNGVLEAIRAHLDR